MRGCSKREGVDSGRELYPQPKLSQFSLVKSIFALSGHNFINSWRIFTKLGLKVALVVPYKILDPSIQIPGAKC